MAAEEASQSLALKGDAPESALTGGDTVANA